ncbi:bifunctional nuclease family protein [Candidatus Bathyarchaeota archaeon]|nr:MAG: bifunctional nuclease family protein [Candidatus Bathyarchaeota archaeon]
MGENVQVQVSGIAQINTPYGPAPALLLEDAKERILVVVIGHAEASSIATALQGVKLPIPNTHDFMVNILDELQAKIKHGEVYDIQANRFLAKLTLEVSGEEKIIEGRPSDIIALTVRTGAVMYVSEEVMEKASIEKSVLLKSEIDEEEPEPEE